jgi:sec-independent protein translocase protein TatA
MVPLFPGLPGGPELLILLFILVIPLAGLAVLALVAYLGIGRLRSSPDHSTDERIRELEREVADLRERLEDEQ